MHIIDWFHILSGNCFILLWCTLRGKIMAKRPWEIEMYFVDGPLTKIDEAILA
jgi:hypothetical protein